PLRARDPVLWHRRKGRYWPTAISRHLLSQAPRTTAVPSWVVPGGYRPCLRLEASRWCAAGGRLPSVRGCKDHSPYGLAARPRCGVDYRVDIDNIPSDTTCTGSALVAKKPAQQSSSMKPFYIGLGAVAVIGIIFLLTQMGSGSAPAREPVLVSISQEELSQVEGISIGRSDAPVVIYEFADFQCPGCGQFAAFTAPLIKERLV